MSFYSECTDQQLDRYLKILQCCNEVGTYRLEMQRWRQQEADLLIREALQLQANEYGSYDSSQLTLQYLNTAVRVAASTTTWQEDFRNIPIRLEQLALAIEAIQESLQLLADRDLFSLSVDADGEGVAIVVGDGGIVEV